MASELSSVSQAGIAHTSVDVMAGHNNSKVLISVDDASLLHSPIEPIRARSLNRLDSLDDGGPEVYRFPSSRASRSAVTPSWTASPTAA